MKRSAPLRRNSPMPRASSPLARTSMIANKSTFKGFPPSRRKRNRRPETGFPPAVRKLIDWRDSDFGQLLACKRCQACGRVLKPEMPRSRQHLTARGIGGTSDPAKNSAANGVTLCGTATTPGSCHLACEKRDPEMYRRGFWRRQSDDPAEHPLHLWDGRIVWPLPDGTWLNEAPAGAA